MIRKYLLPAICLTLLSGCVSYGYRNGYSDGSYYYSRPSVQYYGGASYGYPYRSYGYGGYGYGGYGYGYPYGYGRSYGYPSYYPPYYSRRPIYHGGRDGGHGRGHGGGRGNHGGGHGGGRGNHGGGHSGGHGDHGGGHGGPRDNDNRPRGDRKPPWRARIADDGGAMMQRRVRGPQTMPNPPSQPRAVERSIPTPPGFNKPRLLAPRQTDLGRRNREHAP